MADRVIPPEVPKLAGKPWEEVAPYLEEWLRRLQFSNDETKESLTSLEGVGSEDEPPWAPRPPRPHTHEAADVVGLVEPPLDPRPPSPHIHQPEDVTGLAADSSLLLASQVFGG